MSNNRGFCYESSSIIMILQIVNQHDDKIVAFIEIDSVSRLTPEDLEGNPVNLDCNSFQHIYNLQIYVQNNQSGSDVTQIEQLKFYGDLVKPDTSLISAG